MMALFDSGTSRLHIGFWEDGRLVRTEHVLYPEKRVALIEIVSGLLTGMGATSAAACSVSQTWREYLFQSLASLFPDQLVVARTVADLFLTVPYRNPETYGIDRALAVCAAYHRIGQSCVVADAGTALTVDAVDDHGAVVGGYILPGARLQSAALSDATGLPGVPMDDSGAVLGTDTLSSISLGITYGYLAAAEQLIHLAEGAVNAKGRIVLTGGDAEQLAKVLPETVTVVPGLILEGLGYMADRLPRFS